MAPINQHQPAQRLLLIMPSWVGDTVMALPAVRALRELYPDAHFTALLRANVRPMADACPWIDRIITLRPRRKGMPDARRTGPVNLARRLAAGRFDTAIIFPNSFRSALVARMAGIKRRVGYDRDGRGFLLTDRLLPRRVRGRFMPVPTLDYYLGIARYLGAVDPATHMQLFTRPEHDQIADQLLADAGFDPAQNRPLVIINPGANYGDAKIWFPDRFAAVADRCARQLGAAVAISGAPNERPILDAVLHAATEPLIDLQARGLDLTLLKSVVRRSSLMITNDTGPRHIAAALGVPVVTVFGPTDPAWTRIDFKDERHVRVDVFCGPCQKRTCPLDHRCMTQVTPDMVFAKAAQLVRQGQRPRSGAPA